MSNGRPAGFRLAGLVTCVVVVVSLVAAACSSGGHHRSGSAKPAGTGGARGASTTTTIPAISLGPTGVRSSAVAAENARAGSDGWRIAGASRGSIAGFADRNYVASGDTVGLYVSTPAASFGVVAYRMGYYQGLGGRVVWQSPTTAGSVQPACPVDARTNMASCANWHRSLAFTVSDAFVPGDYLLKLTAQDGAQSYVPLVVWAPSSDATYLVLNRSLVEQGWNTYGGYSYYQGRGPCILDSDHYPPCNRARVVSFDRPYDGNGASDFLENEYPLVNFVEEQGLDVTYCTDICLSEHPSMLLKHRALVGLDHDETWTNSERLAALDAFHKGVNMAFLGAATLVRHARLEPSPLGPDRQEVDYRNASEDPLSKGGDKWEVTGNTWSSSPGGWDATSFLGQIYSGFLEPGEPNAPLVVWDPSAWIFKGTGLAKGAAVPSMINSDIEHIEPAGPMPRNIQVLAHSPISLSQAYTNQGKWGGYTYSDMTYYTDDAGGGAGLFDSGDNIWVGTLSPCPAGLDARSCPRDLVRRMTGNLLWLFGQGPAGRLTPSVSNWRDVTPVGS